MGRSWRSLVIVGLVVPWLLLPQPVASASANDVVGMWNILATLIVESGDPRDPTRPKPGFQKPDRWNITSNGQGLVLTGSQGSITGQLTAQGATFFGRYPIPVGKFQGFVQIRIECMVAGPGVMQGGEEILYFMPNGLGQIQTVPLGREAWRFMARRN